MRIGVVCPEAVGHLNPITTLGRELARRGDQLVVIGGRTSGFYAQRAGLEYAGIGLTNGLADVVEESFRAVGSLGGLAVMRQSAKALAAGAQLTLDGLPAVLDSAHFDGLIVDQVSPAAAMIAQRRSMPFVVVSNAIAIFNDPYAPPPVLHWGYREDWWGRFRNFAAKKLLFPVYERSAQVRKTGVKPLLLAMEETWGLARLAQQPHEFDFPNRSLPEQFHYTGPWNDAARDDHDTAFQSFPWDKLDGRPLIYASMGTLHNNLRHVFQAICDAARNWPAQVVLSRGGGPEDSTLNPPENVILVNRAPQLRLLEKAALAITHAGLNTALECAGRAVPMICLPVTNDQPGVAKRVEWLGLGKSLPVAQVNSKRLNRMVLAVLGDEERRVRCRRFSQAIEGRSGIAMAADIIRQAFSTGRPVLRSELARPFSAA